MEIYSLNDWAEHTEFRKRGGGVLLKGIWAFDEGNG